MPNAMRCRLCWKVTLAVFASILVIEGAILIPSYINYERDQLASVAMAARQSLDAAIGDGLAASDGTAIMQRLAETQIAGYRIETDERVLSGGEPIPPDVSVSGTLRQRRAEGNRDRMLTRWDIDHDGTAATVIASLDTSHIGPALKRFVLRISGLVLLIAGFVTVVTMVVPQRMVLGPLLRLNQRIHDEDQALTAESKYYAADQPPRDELAQTRWAFEAMRERSKADRQRIEKSEQRYRQLSQELDERVAERTHELERANEALEHRAYYDELTGLPNRQLFHHKLEATLANSQASTAPVAVMVVGLEELGSINGVYGYSTGDSVLRVLGSRLEAATPDDWAIAHFGGVFAVLKPGEPTTTPSTELMDTGERIRRAMEVPIELADGTLQCAARVGIAISANAGESAEDLMGQADLALVHAMRGDSDRVRLFDERMNSEVQQRLERIAAMRRGLSAGEFFPVYQAQCRDDGSWVGVEALMRWHTAEGGAVSPGEFIPLAESTGLIVALGSQVLASAIAQAAAWYHQGHPLRVAVNLSVIQLRTGNIVKEIETLLAHHQLPAEWLTAEITESGLITDLQRGSSVLAGLTELGVDIAIDDFGTGYSSLAYLGRLPVDELKIDKQFIDGLPHDQNSVTLCRTIIEMGRTLGKRIVAEGVETAEQRDWLAAHGCQRLQGFLFSKPTAAGAIAWPADHDPAGVDHRRTPA